MSPVSRNGSERHRNKWLQSNYKLLMWPFCDCLRVIWKLLLMIDMFRIINAYDNLINSYDVHSCTHMWKVSIICNYFNLLWNNLPIILFYKVFFSQSNSWLFEFCFPSWISMIRKLLFCTFMLPNFQNNFIII